MSGNCIKIGEQESSFIMGDIKILRETKYTARKFTKMMAMFGIAVTMMASTAFAGNGTWTRYGSTYKYVLADGSIVHDTFTDDGYWVDHNGNWVKSTIPNGVAAQKSVGGKRVIAISKAAHILELWQNGSLVKSYKCSTGMNSGDKEREGDAKTPVGEFYVCLMNNNSTYTKGIGVSYPMTEDAVRGLKAGLITKYQYKSIVDAVNGKGKPDWYTNLGGEIEIHGGSGENYGNASHGCIVLSNTDMLDLFGRVGFGDTILIYE